MAVIQFRTWALRAVVAALALGAVAPRAVQAQIGSDRYASIIIDASTGTVLSAASPDEYRFPASLTKLMTIYMLFEAVRDRRLSMDQLVPVSHNAASMSPTKLGLVPGSRITVEQALLGLVTKSANDAAAALGELLGGDEERFAQMMTLRARALGMSNTTFRNASGLPDWSQVTTARDMATLGRRLIQDFPGQYHYFSTPSFVYAGRTVMNHQRLLHSYPGADGLKTGYIIASGYNVVTSAVRGSTRLVGVVMGGASGGERDEHMAALLDQGFERMGAPMMVSRREPSFGLPFISSAQAAPIVLRPMQAEAPRYAPEPPPRRFVAARPERWEPREPERAVRVAGRGFGRAPERMPDRVIERAPARRLAPTAVRATAVRATAVRATAVRATAVRAAPAARAARIAEPPRAAPRAQSRTAAAPQRWRG